MANTIFFCGILAMLVFSIQLSLCAKAQGNVVKYIPPSVILAIYVIALAMGLVDILDGSGGVAIWAIFAYVLSIINTVALVADLAAWLVYKRMKRRK